MRPPFSKESAAKSEGEAKNLFQKKLRDAVRGGHVIYVISEEEYLPLLPDGAVRVLVKADLDTIKERFRARMRGNLPAPVEKMLERNHGRFDGIACDFSYDASCANPDDLCARILEKAGQDSSGV